MYTAHSGDAEQDVYDQISCEKLLEKDILENTKLYQELQKRESKYKAQIDETYKYASRVLPKINRVFANYTGHGIEHSVNVMQYMYDLVTDISAISDLEITCLIYAALLHDIGMADIQIAIFRRNLQKYVKLIQ